MTSINISIKREAYEFLNSIKGDKSFSEAILEFKKQEQSILQFFGVLKELDWGSKEDSIKGLRESFEEKLS
ncbi:MAG: antitoxin VapB family protein [Nanoarchaeota archaeon]